MQNAWNVLWIEDGRKKIKVFEGDSPKASGAIEFAKTKRTDSSSAELISRRKAFPPPAKLKEPPGPGFLWCPYCIKWREFEVSEVVRRDYRTPDILRCTVCTISVKDYFVRRYNPLFVERYETEQEMKKTKVAKKIPTTGGRRRRR